MRVKEAIKKFLVAIRADGVKKATVTWYRVRFRRFLAMYGDRYVRELDIDNVRSYIVKVQEEDVSRHTFFSWVRVVRRLFKWLYEERKIDDNLYKRIKLPELPQPDPKAVEMDDVVRLLKARKSVPGAARDRAVILFLLDTGCRVGGLCSLRVRALALENLRATIYEKGDKSRMAFFGDDTGRALEGWMSDRPYGGPGVGIHFSC